MSTLIFTLPLHSENGASYSQTVLPTQTAGARDKEIWAIVPAAALSWHKVNLPAGLQRQTQRLLTALQSLLEEPLLDDIDNLHVALQPNWQAGQTAWVAVCNKAWLQGHLNQLQARGNSVHRIVPEWPPASGAASPDFSAWISGTPDAAQLWVHDGQGAWHLPLQAGLIHLIELLQKTASTDIGKLPRQVTIQTDPAVAVSCAYLELCEPDLRQAAEHASRVLDIPVTGLDFLVPAVDGPEHVIIEANERPGLANHEPQPTAQRFVDLLFPATAQPEDAT